MEEIRKLQILSSRGMNKKYKKLLRIAKIDQSIFCMVSYSVANSNLVLNNFK